MHAPTSGQLAFLIVALAIACGFEMCNGFHDTANAVATVIYSRSLKPTVAVVWSGFCNFMGVYLGGTAVAFSIVHLLPVDLLVNVGSHQGMAMVLALLVAAILWNFGTWYLGLPSSSSHTLIGSILGVGVAYALLSGMPAGTTVNWAKAREVGLSLLISPMLGFVLSALLLVLAKRLIREPHLYEPPGEKPPPRWIRGILILTCTGVSFAHGSNDGQKGVGLMMLILIGILPARYALNEAASAASIRQTAVAVSDAETILRRHAGNPEERMGSRYFVMKLDQVHTLLEGRESLAALPPENRWQVRTDILQVDSELAKLAASADLPNDEEEQRLQALRGAAEPALPPPTRISRAEKQELLDCRIGLRAITDYAPDWVLLMVALSLGVGTTIGWKRIVVTVGEKIGKAHLTYAQGAAAELVAMTTIGLADHLGMPVSTTQVLSSGIAGTMAANRSGVQGGTVRAIAMTWVLTLPASMLLAGLLFVLFRIAVP